MTVAEMKERFVQVKSNLVGYAHDIVVQDNQQITSLLKSQLEVGQKETGPIEPNYKSKSYAVKKQNMGSKAPFGVPDLRYTGSFYSQMALKFHAPDEFSMMSDDKKWYMLMRRYGVEIMNIKEETLKVYIMDNFKPKFIKSICDYTGARAI